ncbi:zinc ribbon domain-containing protein [Ferrimicrobium sp.]|uniref:zinc ribbon domain-containing protein n=1 Tax=Ferrimicrobium sp. TaxID=2926050 RepID=UPI00345C23BE
MVIGISFLVVVFSYRHSGRESHPTRSLTANFLACLQLPSQRPREIIIEDLSHLQGKAKSKNISRLCSSWATAENQERITVHAYVGGSGIKTVNAAYSSQTCPDPGCGYVHRDNRHGDMFHCRNPYWECNWQGDVDHVAAMNIKSRIEDHQINRFTPFGEVKKILEERFLRANGKPEYPIGYQG